jgi:hypothetical protein
MTSHYPLFSLHRWRWNIYQPEVTDLRGLNGLLQAFIACSGLSFNMTKTEIYPIRCLPCVADALIQVFPRKISIFPKNTLACPFISEISARLMCNLWLIRFGLGCLDGRGSCCPKQGVRPLSKQSSPRNQFTTSRFSQHKNTWSSKSINYAAISFGKGWNRKTLVAGFA